MPLEKVVHIFQGVLIEEFISSVSEIGPLDAKRPVCIFYDTAGLMRLMGCSGKSLRTVGLTQFGGHPEAFARGVPDAQDTPAVFA